MLLGSAKRMEEWFITLLLHNSRFKGVIMDKYGVEIPEEKTKHGSAGECTECGGKLDTSSNPPRCPSCGYEPQEKKPKGS